MAATTKTFMPALVTVEALCDVTAREAMFGMFQYDMERWQKEKGLKPFGKMLVYVRKPDPDDDLEFDKIVKVHVLSRAVPVVMLSTVETC